MTVRGTMKVEVDIDASEAIEVIRNNLGLKEGNRETTIKILEKDHPKNKCKKKAIYEVTDMSWYGSYSDSYRCITTDEHKIELFEAYLLLENAIKNKENIM